MLKKLQNRIKDSQAQWDKIEKLAEELQEHVDNDEAVNTTTAQLLLMVIEQLKPIYKINSDMANSFEDLFKI